MASNEIERYTESIAGADITTTEATILREQLDRAVESLAALELSREDRGWSKLTTGAVHEFSREGFRRNAEIGRVLAIGNPMTKRALALRHAYVWGQGVGTTARGDGTEGQQDVNDLVQSYLDDDRNRAAFTGAQASEQLEKALGTDGNVFLANFTDPLTGEVQTRTLPFDEVEDIILNPDDRTDPWFYKRVYARQVLNLTTGKLDTTATTSYYPSIYFRPAMKPRTINGDPILWDAPVYHVKANALDGWKYGVGDVYASAAWVRAYKEFLEDWTVLMKSLSRIAWQLVTEKKTGAQAARTAVMAGQGEAGQVAVSAGAKLEAVPKTGATIDSDSGRPLAAMAAAGFGLPVTMLLADPGVTGARATAQTLDLPTRLELGGRRELWTECRRAILGYAIDASVIAPMGPLKGTVQRKGDRLVSTLAKNTDRTLEIVWPELDETPIDLLVKAITDADGTGKMPPLVTIQLLLRALNVRDVDEILEKLTDPKTGEWLNPDDTAGAQAARDFRDGKDPNQNLDAADTEIQQREQQPDA
jgi:hypothetical protein